MRPMKITSLPATLIATTATLAAIIARSAEKDTRVFEMRTYYASPGKLDALHARFRDHTKALFEKHGMTNLGYWTPIENPENKLVYVLAYPSREAREVSWKEFSADPDWVKARTASEADGKLVAKVEQLFLSATEFFAADSALHRLWRARLRASHLHHHSRQSAHPSRTLSRSHDRAFRPPWHDQSILLEASARSASG